MQVVDYDEDTGHQNGKPSTLPILTSNHHPKALTEICMQVGSESLPICFLDLTDSNNPKAPKTKNRKMIDHHHSIDRTKTFDYNVTRKQNDNNKNNTSNE